MGEAGTLFQHRLPHARPELFRRKLVRPDRVPHEVFRRLVHLAEFAQQLAG
jgi:hypothetical protein